MGVYLIREKKYVSSWRESAEQSYFSTRPNGQKIKTLVTGSEHGDFRIIQTDLTHYETISPFENISSFRPLLREDTTYCSPYHSTEPTFFSIFLKYAEQVEKKEELAEVMDVTLQEYA